jgi:hypothetical protein
MTRITDSAARSLALQIARGAGEGDGVRLHGAIAAALDLYPTAAVVATVFTPALGIALRGYGDDCREAVVKAIRHQVAWRSATGYRLGPSW